MKLRLAKASQLSWSWGLAWLSLAKKVPSSPPGLQYLTLSKRNTFDISLDCFLLTGMSSMLLTLIPSLLVLILTWQPCHPDLGVYHPGAWWYNKIVTPMVVQKRVYRRTRWRGYQPQLADTGEQELLLCVVICTV